jgi:hypothetical protein
MTSQNTVVSLPSSKAAHPAPAVAHLPRGFHTPAKSFDDALWTVYSFCVHFESFLCLLLVIIFQVFERTRNSPSPGPSTVAVVTLLVAFCDLSLQFANISPLSSHRFSRFQ